MTTAEMSSEEKVLNNLKYWDNADLKRLFEGILRSKDVNLDKPYSMGESYQLSKLKNLIRSTQAESGYNNNPNITMHVDDDEWEREMGRFASGERNGNLNK